MSANQGCSSWWISPPWLKFMWEKKSEKEKERKKNTCYTSTQMCAHIHIKTSPECRVAFCAEPRVGVHTPSWADGKTESSWLTTLRRIGPKRRCFGHTCCTFATEYPLRVCACMRVCPRVAAAMRQSATCSSWLQLNGKLEILTIDSVVCEWFEKRSM